MSNYKNPYVRLERLSFSVIDRFVSITHSSLEKQLEDNNESEPRSAKLEETDEEITDVIIITEEENESQPRITKPKEENESRTRFQKPERATGRPSRSAKQKVKTYCFESASKDESSDNEEPDIEGDSNYSDESDTNSKQKVKTYRFKSASEDESSDYEESDLEGDSNHSDESDFEYNPNSKSGEKRQGTSKSEKKNGKKQKTGKVKGLTEYEKLILKNKKEKNAFLDSLKINEVKEGFAESIKGYNKVGKRKWSCRPKPVPRRKIARSSKVDNSLSEEAIQARSDSKAMKTLEAMEKKEIVVNLPALLHLEDVLDSDQSYEFFLHDLKDFDQGHTEPIDNNEFRFQDVEMLESRVEHFSHTKLTAMDIHPMRENTVIAAGGRNGKLYLWNINSKPYAFKVHKKSIYHLKFNPENPHLIVCASKDGSLREGDLVANVYKKVTNDTDCIYFDFLSNDTCLVSHRDGYVSVVDMRERRTMNRMRRMTHKCHDGWLRSVSVHPVNKNEFITPTSKGCVRLWDLRKLQKDPVIEAQHEGHNIALHSAIFSPLTGKAVLASLYSGRICLFDTSLWSMAPSCMHSLQRNKDCRATWQPRTDRKFVVGSRICPRRIEIFNYRHKIFSYSHEWLQGVISFCTFHPSLPIIAAVEGSTVSVFANKDH